MKKTLLFILLSASAVLATLFAACGGKWEDDPMLMPYSIEVVDTLTPADMNWGGEGEQLHVCRSRDEAYEHLREQASLPEIDFSTKNLVLAYGIAPQCVDSVSACMEGIGNEVTVDITVALGDCDMPSPWFIAFVCDRVPPKATVSLQVSMTW